MSVTTSQAGAILRAKLGVQKVDRERNIARGWRLYYGQFDPSLAKSKTDPFAHDNVSIGYTGLVVDTVVSWLFGDVPEWQIPETSASNAEDDPAGEAARARMTKELNAVWEQSAKMLLLQQLAINGAVTGHAFLKIIPPDPGYGERYPRLEAIDPSNVEIETDPFDSKRRTGYVIQWDDVDAAGNAITYRQEIRRSGERPGFWLVRDLELVEGGTTWVVVREMLWPRPWPPLLDCQHLPAPNEVYGRSEIDEQLFVQNRAINFGFSNNNRILRTHGHPRLGATGVAEGEEIPSGVDDAIGFENPDAEVFLLEMKNSIEHSFGQVDRLTEALFRTRRLPLIAIGDVKAVSNLSGPALSLYLRPLVKKVETLRETYGELLIETNRRLLSLMGYGEMVRITIKWPELLPPDLLPEAQAYEVHHRELGASRETILRKLQYDPELEKARREAEDAADLSKQEAQMKMVAANTPAPAASPNGREGSE